MRRAISLIARTPVPVHARQRLRLGQVRRDHRGQREQVGPQRPDGIRAQQHVAALGHHHRVHHQAPDAVLPDLVGDGADDAGVGEHAGLDRVGADVVHDGVDLRGHDRGRSFEDPRDAGGVLGGDGGNHGGAVDPQGREGLEVRLKAGSGPGVRARDGECLVDLHGSAFEGYLGERASTLRGVAAGCNGARGRFAAATFPRSGRCRRDRGRPPRGNLFDIPAVSCWHTLPRVTP